MAKKVPVSVDLSKLRDVVKNDVVKKAAYSQKTDYNTKMTEIEKNIPSINGFATNAALTAVEDKISNTSNLVKKASYDIKITEIEKTLLIMIMINMLLPQNSIIYQQGFLLQR